jgi:Protein NO VEIN, C-terminal
MRLRGVRVFYTVQDIFEHVRRRRSTEAGLVSASTLFGPATSEAISLAGALGWLARDSTGHLHPTGAGLAAHPEGARSLRLRFQLHAFILHTKPSWSALLCRGRREAAAQLPAEIRQCLQDAGLLEGIDDATVQWWDSLAVASRVESQHELLTIGRFGERLSLHYERNRVGIDPLWQALESNSAGYDILSWVASGRADRLLIEVKCSVLTQATAHLHITRYEWQTARTANNAVFHLWIVRPDSRCLWILTPEQVRPHVPDDHGAGEWESVCIPFSSLTASAPDVVDTASTPTADLLPDHHT